MGLQYWNLDQHTEGNFNDINLDEIFNRRDELGLSNLEIVKGHFENTAENDCKSFKIN